ncbi:tripartite-type tricarboxylate transporter receptor subunit TctC [Roseomonas alkaliterrae]|uniref:Tripartite-type tricarboxylate transporter receptor subunit TctC n=2 Tax=Neoroseomonas alkaliterrae TaxID=1452450 RepID=A0A840XWM3_9PROT|nr:tripartite tricarboxylate transporter substrate-binding protein [Neoroseomonas alkaliterrae]MBB5688547.1 tripartite-type tricarboxylate transporter receptor subunit TctC [Neoroseomonas alkaliterrae]
MLRRRAVLASPALLATPALAQPYPGPVRIIVPFAPGGTTDIITRLIADEMARRLSTTIVVENRPGAGATLGTGLVARAAPDGQTLLVSTISGMAVGHTLYRDRIQWDADRDFAHIAIMLGTPYLLLVHPAQPIRTVADFIAAAKRPPGLAYATSGIGSVPHLIGLRLAQAAGFELQHIPYRGGAQAATDAIAGVVPSVMDSLTAASAYIRAGSLRVIAFTTRERVPDFPEVPTFVESGFPDIVADGWAGIAAPAGTPRPLQERLAGAIREAIAAPAVARRYAETSTLPGTRFLDDAQAFVRSEIAACAPVVRASGATPG